MSSVSPSSSVSKMEVKKGRVGLEQPQAPSFYLGDMSTVVDVGVRARVLESYYLALAKYYDAIIDCGVDGDSARGLSDAREPAVVPSVSGVSSASSRRRRRRRDASVVSEHLGATSDLVVVPSLSYLLMVRSEHRYDVRVELGESPALSVVMALPLDKLIPIHLLDGVRCKVDSQHFEFVRDSGGMSISSLVSAYAFSNTICCGSLGGAFSPVSPARMLSPGLVAGLVCDQFDAVDRQQSGYDYTVFLRRELSQQIRAKVGPHPTLLAVMQLPLSSVVPGVFDKPVDCQLGEHLHVREGLGTKFGEIAVTAIALSGIRFARMSLGAYLVGKYCAVEGSRVNMWWRIGHVDVVLFPND